MTAAHAVPWSRPQSWAPTLVGALLGSLAVCLFGRLGAAAEELPRPAKNLTRLPGVDTPVDTGG